MKIKDELDKIRAEIRHLVDRMVWLEQNKAALEKLPEASFCGDRLDFDYLPHADVIKVVRELGGKWKKTKNTTVAQSNGGKEKVDYESTVDGVKVRCWAGDPPPSCRLVEIEEDVPEQIIPAKVIPAHKKKVLKMICTGQGEPVAEAIARANGFDRALAPSLGEPGQPGSI